MPAALRGCAALLWGVAVECIDALLGSEAPSGSLMGL